MPPVQPGEIVQHDYRQHCELQSESSSSPPDVASFVSLRCVQWNIERGYQLPAVIAELRALDADIISLQEIDVDCERSGGVDTGRAIASALHLNYAYLCEFLELRSPLRSPLLQGGVAGHHGHAVLTKHELLQVSCLRHQHQPLDWEKEGEMRGEPRRGERVTLKAIVGCGCGVSVLLYNAHLEVFCGLLDRVRVLADIFHDARRESDHYPHQMILADANTSHDSTALTTASPPPRGAMQRSASHFSAVSASVC
jgi:endonuclease/exonuclease/phosphatase family metal-dependent hydrolase